MTHQLYMFRDRVSGLYTDLTWSVKDETMIREIRSLLENRAVNANWCRFPQDYDLYWIGTIDDVSGQLTRLDNPTFVARFGDMIGGDHSEADSV